MKRKLTVKPRSGRMRKEKIFAISYTETYERGYFVKATSFDEACEKRGDAIMNGQVDGPEYCIDSSYLDTTGDFTQKELEGGKGRCQIKS